jgi:hypothetical protein
MLSLSMACPGMELPAARAGRGGVPPITGTMAKTPIKTTAKAV